MNRIEKTVHDLALPVVEAQGLELWDVEYVTEGGQKYLRIYLDGPEGGTNDPTAGENKN